MAQHDYDIANGSGSTVRADINAVLGAIASNNSGTSAPSVTFAFMFWADTTSGYMKMRNSGNTAWISLYALADGTFPTASLADNSVTDAKLRQGAALTVIGRASNSTGNVADIAASNDGEVLRRSGTSLGFGTVATAGIAANAVTDAKLRQGTALTVIGRSANSTGDVADIAASNDGEVLRRSGTSLGFGTVATAGIADAAITSAKLRDSAALSVIGRSANSSGVPADIAAANDGEVLRRSGTALGFGTVATAGIAANAVTNAKFRQGAALSVVGVTGNATADVADIAAANDGEVLRRSGTSLGFGTVATAGIADDAITNAKLANMAANTIKGRVTGSTGDPEDLSAANVKTILALVKGDVGLGNVDNTSDVDKPVSTAQQTALDLKANLASPAFTGTPTAPTPSGSDDTTKIATTEWVNDAIAGAVASGVADGDKGDITVSGSGLAWAIDNDVVTNAKLANMAVNTIKGRLTAGTGDPEDLSAANVKTILALTASDVGLGTSSNPQFATVELGAASDTTLSRGAAGFMAVEGKRVPSPASQATGDILVRGSTEWDRLAIGTAGQKLRVNSGATALEYETTWETIFNGAVSAAAQHDFTGLSAFRILRVQGYIIPATNSVSLKMRVGIGTTYDAGANYNRLVDYQASNAATPTGANSGGDDAVLLYLGNLSNTDGWTFEIDIHQFNKATETIIRVHMNGKSSDGNRYRGILSVHHQTAAAQDALRFIPGSGNITGFYQIEGLRG
jgi:hypothetical protein